MLLLVKEVVAKGSRIGFNVPSRLARSGVSTTADAASQPASQPKQLSPHSGWRFLLMHREKTIQSPIN
jgi:hypothetical protein